MNQLAVSLGCVVGSVVVHTALLLGAPEHVATPRLPRPPAVVELRVTAPSPPQSSAEPKPVATPAPELTPKPILPAKARSVPAEPEPVTPEPPEPAEPPATPTPEPQPEPPEPQPAELTGSTLAGDGQATWSAPAGNAEARRGALTAGTHPTRKAAAAGSGGAAALPAATTAVPLGQLSRRPEPPPLARALERNYPARERSLGRSGEAKVRARIEPDGTVRIAKLLFETSAGFGEACRATLLASRWTAPLDARGKPAATWITYLCKFRVGT